MLGAVIPKSAKNEIWFTANIDSDELLIRVLTEIAKHQIIIDDRRMAPDIDIYTCHSAVGDFAVIVDGSDVEIVGPDRKVAEMLLPIFK